MVVVGASTVVVWEVMAFCRRVLTKEDSGVGASTVMLVKMVTYVNKYK